MRLLLVFLKEPIPGLVKTRLAADIGQHEAARYYKAMVEVILIQLRGLTNCRIRFCYAPDDADDAIRFWLLPEMGARSSENHGIYIAPTYSSYEKDHQQIDFRPQGHGNLGERLARAFAEAFADDYSSVAVIGTDCPECGARWINTAFSRLEASATRDAVIGPSHDGGYYLLATKSPAQHLFKNIPWSQSDVLNATLSAAQSYGTAIIQLPSLGDIDTLDDWNKLLSTPLGAAIKKKLGEDLPENELTDLQP